METGAHDEKKGACMGEKIQSYKSFRLGYQIQVFFGKGKTKNVTPVIFYFFFSLYNKQYQGKSKR